jgi:hypothetical protein
MNRSHEKDISGDKTGTMGTFAGVFTPSILTILGIILFLRLGYVVGSAGLGRALIIIILANGISVLTSISLSAIATNIKVKGIGVYYLISRTLGPEFGGAIGIGPLKANTILLNWLDPESESTDDQREINLGRNLRAAYRLGRNIVVLNADEDKWRALEKIPGEDRRIDVWWLNDATSRLMLLLSYLITRSEPWDAAKIRVLAAGYNADTPENLMDLKNNLEEARIEAEPIIVTKADIDKLTEYSKDAAVVFLPFRLRGDRITCSIDGPLEKLLSRLPFTVFVLAAEDIALDAEPEEGTAGDMAVAMDALADVEKKAVEAEKELDPTVESNFENTL